MVSDGQAVKFWISGVLGDSSGGGDRCRLDCGALTRRGLGAGTGERRGGWARRQRLHAGVATRAGGGDDEGEDEP